MTVDHILRTERLVLRPVTVHDHTALLAHWTDPVVRRFLFDDEVLPPDEVLAVIAESESTFADGGYGIWAVQAAGELAAGEQAAGEQAAGEQAAGELAAGELAGTAGLRPLEDLGIELVYSLAPPAWGKGYATEAAGAVLDYAFGPLGLPEVLAEIDQGNAASVAVIERLGMVPYDLVPGVLGPMTRYRKVR